MVVVRRIRIILILLLAGVLLAPALPVGASEPQPAPTVSWMQQLDSRGFDAPQAMAIDTWGSVYVTGFTSGAIPGQQPRGGTDAFIVKYDSRGNQMWARQFGASLSSNDYAFAIAVDSSGNAYVAGYTESTFSGHAPQGMADAFVRKYDTAGNELWTQQFGASGRDSAAAVAIDSAGNAYVAGIAEGAFRGQVTAGGGDAFLRKYDGQGNELWTRQFGTRGWDGATSIAVDLSDFIYVAGQAGGALAGHSSSGGYDAFVRKYTGDGEETWTRQFGGIDYSDERVTGVAVDSMGNVYLAGNTDGFLPGYEPSRVRSWPGAPRDFLRKYNGAGTELWTRQLVEPARGPGPGVAVGSSGNIYVAGSGGGALVRKYDAGGNEIASLQQGYGAARGIAVDGFENIHLMGLQEEPFADHPGLLVASVFVSKLDGQGTELWRRWFGSSGSDHAYAVTVDQAGNAYLVGLTDGTFTGETWPGNSQVLVAKYDDSGTLSWLKQFRNSIGDTANVAADSAGGIYVVGFATGGQDAFVRKYGAEGNELWTRVFGTRGYYEVDDVAVDGAGDVYVTAGAILRKYSSEGDELWSRRLPPGLSADNVAAGASDYVYLVGTVHSSLPGQIAASSISILKYDSSGNELWLREFGTGRYDQPHRAVADGAGNLYIAGFTNGVFPGQTRSGSQDAFVAKLDASGNLVWVNQFGTSGADQAYGVAVDRAGNSYVAGLVRGPLEGQTYSGETDAFVRKYNSSGSVLWTYQFGTSGLDRAYGVALDETGGLYVTGYVGGVSTGRILPGNANIFIMKLAEYSG
ncbi:MAG: SBBP repeat-containing protein [Chloroflexi bacterium]|nr:SBBP repeat-containing protein [Chloroflexota bacterium]